MDVCLLILSNSDPWYMQYFFMWSGQLCHVMFYAPESVPPNNLLDPDKTAEQEVFHMSWLCLWSVFWFNASFSV